MDTLLKASKLTQPTIKIVMGSKVYLFTDKEYAKLIDATIKKLQPGMRQLKSAVEQARYLWDFHNKLNNDQYIVSWCIEVYAGMDLPKEAKLKAAEKAVGEAEKALKSKDLKRFTAVFGMATTKTDTARIEIKTYVSAMQEGGSSIVTGLEIIKGTSFLVVGIIAAPVAASTFGVGAIAAGVIAGAGTAGIETLAGEVGKGVAGTSQGFDTAMKNVLLDSFIGGSIGALVKGKFAEKTFKSVVPALAKRRKRCTDHTAAA